MYKSLIFYLSSALFWVQGQDQVPFYKLTTAGSCQSGARQRPSIYAMPNQDWRRYVNAINKLNQGPRPTRWDQLSDLHMKIYPDIHSKASFFAWHRAFLYILERELQSIDKDVMIPYWDWSIYSQTPEKDPVLSDLRFGGNGNPNDNQRIDSGPFRDFQVLYDGGSQNGKPHVVRRSFTQQDGKITAWLNPDVINGMILEAKDFKNFWNMVEAGPHGVIHNGIGGDFSGHASPSDPLFYSHHAFVDKLWFDWVMRDESRMSQYAFDDSVASLDSKLNSFNITISQVLDIKKSLCYYYPEDHFSYKKAKAQRRAVDSNVWNAYTTAKELSTIKPLDAYVEMECDNEEDLKQHDLAYVMKGVSAPSPFDRKDINKLRVPEPQPEEFLKRMGYNIALVRQVERKFALFTDALNRNQNFVSSAALTNLNNFPKIRKVCKPKHT